LSAAQHCHMRLPIASRTGRGVAERDEEEAGPLPADPPRPPRDAAEAGRAARLARALRLNLRRRKEQARARSRSPREPEGG
jgi:hypothetical protein